MQRVKNKFNLSFPNYGEDNVKWFYVVTILGNSWFQLGNWLLFVLLFMGEREFAVYEAVAFGIGILVEIPSGAFADMLGKKRAVSIGLFMQAFGSVIFTLGFLGNGYFFFGNLIMIVAFAFISGSLEALVYDSLVEKKKEKHYDDIIGKARSLDILASIVASAIGGILWQYSIYAPWALTAFVFFIAFFLSFKFIEPSIDTEIFSFKNFINQNKKGFYFLFRSDFRKYTLSFALITGSFLMWSAGIIRVLMGRDFGYDGSTINYLISATLLVSFFTTFSFFKIRKKLGDKIGFSLLLATASLAWILSGLFSNSMLIGALVFIIITVSGKLSEVWTSVILNAHVKSKDRATAISTLSFLIQIPYVLLVVMFGNMIADGSAATFYIVTGLMLAIGLVSFYRAESTKVIVTETPKL